MPAEATRFAGQAQPPVCVVGGRPQGLGFPSARVRSGQPPTHPASGGWACSSRFLGDGGLPSHALFLSCLQEEGGIDPTLMEVMVQGVFCKSWVWGGCLSLELMLSGCLGSSSYASCMEANWPPGSLLMGSRGQRSIPCGLNSGRTKAGMQCYCGCMRPHVCVRVSVCTCGSICVPHTHSCECAGMEVCMQICPVCMCIGHVRLYMHVHMFCACVHCLWGVCTRVCMPVAFAHMHSRMHTCCHAPCTCGHVHYVEVSVHVCAYVPCTACTWMLAHTRAYAFTPVMEASLWLPRGPARCSPSHTGSTPPS